MKVERSTVDQVKERFDVLKKKKEEKKKEYDIEQKMKEMGEEVNFLLSHLLSLSLTKRMYF